MTMLGCPSVDAYRDQIARALEHAGGTHTVDDVLDGIATGHMQYWPCGEDTIVVTELVQHPRRTVLHIFLAAGRMADIERAAPLILSWGRSQGATAATLVGRRGWMRSFLPRTGWRDTQWVTMTKEL